ncbi:MAG: hypothetical protein OXI64_06440 [Defluviicoccus sp.]|nr:hypothetical protein [Defluviicoccus sp.]
MNERDLPKSSAASGMSLGRFAELVQAYGGDFERWPEADRYSGISLAGRSEEARTLLAEAHGLDYLLSRFGAPPPPSDALVERVTALERDSASAVEISSPAGRTLFRAMRSNALTVSVVLNLFLAAALGGVWIGSGSSPGTASEVAYGPGDVQATLPDEDEAALGEELGTPVPVDPNFVEFDSDASDDFDIASWPDADQPPIDAISPI